MGQFGWIRKLQDFMIFFFLKTDLYDVGHACKVYIHTKLAQEEITYLSSDQIKLAHEKITKQRFFNAYE